MTKNDVIVITGGSSGFGKETARLFSAKGAKVVIVSHNSEKLEAAAKEVNADCFVADVSKPADWSALYDFIDNKYGKIDLLFNSAGGGIAIKKIIDTSIEQIEKTVALNLNSVIYGCKTFAPMFLKQEQGTIINVASACAKQAWPTWSVYAASKWGVLGFTKGMTTELSTHGIRVSCLVPGASETNFCNAANVDLGYTPKLKPEHIAETIYNVYNLPQDVWVEEIVMWGMDQIVVPL